MGFSTGTNSEKQEGFLKSVWHKLTDHPDAAARTDTKADDTTKKDEPEKKDEEKK